MGSRRQTKDDQGDAPLVKAMRSHVNGNAAAFDAPGHQSGQSAPLNLVKLIGEQAFAGDTTEQKGLDDRRQRQRVRQRAEELAAEAWGADTCFFSTNGSSLSNHSTMCAVAGPGDLVLIARNSHKSLIGSTIIANVRVAFLEPDYDSEWGIAHGVSVAEVERQLDRHPDAKAVFITSPTYYGVTSDIRRIARLCHKRGLPLMVDEAWGPHFPFHPDMPRPAIQEGADLTVGSIHKTMSALSGASIMLLKSKLISADRLNNTYDLFESTSPSGPILSSIDASRHQFVKQGEQLIGRTMRFAERVRKAASKIDGVKVMTDAVLNGDSRHGFDPTKILLDIRGLGVNGWEAEDWMMEELEVAVGLSDEHRLLIILTSGHTSEDVTRLIDGLNALAAWARDDRKPKQGLPKRIPKHVQLKADCEIPPAQAFYAPYERVPLSKLAGRIAAEMVSFYPPGIPRIVPGQRVTEAQAEYLRVGMEYGAFPFDASDLDLRTVRVVKE
jgi:arginine/lysine/ornithine decarboxylase